MSTRSVTVRLPEELISAIDSRAEELQAKRTPVIIDLLERALSNGTPSPVSLDQEVPQPSPESVLRSPSRDIAVAPASLFEVPEEKIKDRMEQLRPRVRMDEYRLRRMARDQLIKEGRRG
jgi:hypothetical protein